MALSLELLVVCLIVLVLVSGFFSGSETAMIALNRYRLRHMVKQRHRGALRVKRLLDHPDRLLSVILIGNTFANVVASSIATYLTIDILHRVGRQPNNWILLLGDVALTLIILIFAEIGPKTLAVVKPERLAFFAASPLTVMLYLAYPVVWLANSSAALLLKCFGVSIQQAKHEVLSTEELRTVVHEAGVLMSAEHKEMLLSIIDLEKVTVEDIMVPRGDIIGIDLAEPLDEIIEQLENSQHTRLPLYQHSIDQVVGMVHMRDVVNLMAERRFNKEALSGIATDCYFVPEGTPLNTQILNFKQAKCRSGLIVDEYGDILGLVTLEDILEEIVGEFTTDRADFSRTVSTTSDGAYLLDGSISVRELNRLLQLQLPTDGPKTLSGLLTEYLQDIPPVGVSVKVYGGIFEVLQVKENIIKTLKLRLPDEKPL